MSKILERAREPSTWGGIAAVALGLGELLKWREATDVASAITDAGQVAVTSGDPVIAIVALIAGIIAAIRKG